MQENSIKRILILGGGFAAIQVAHILENEFAGDPSIKITLVSRDNFFLFTPMLPEVASGTIETRHIVTPIRQFCQMTNFCASEVESIDLENRTVTISHSTTRHLHTLAYDYLVIAVGSITNFFGMANVERHALTLKTLGDAILLRNHVIDMLEQADIEEDPSMRRQLLTYVVAGGGFAGIETVGELHDFLYETIKHYRNISPAELRIVLVEAMQRILPEMEESLAEFAIKKFREAGIELRLNVGVADATENEVVLRDGTRIPTKTLIWTVGVAPHPLLEALPCKKERGKLVVNEFLELENYPNVWALGDCAHIINRYDGKPCPPTAQHAVREGITAGKNIIAAIRGTPKTPFRYKMLGQMAILGHRKGVGVVFGFQVQGFLAWWLWRSYYLFRLPTLHKKIRVMIDWAIALFFERDITQIKGFQKTNVSVEVRKKVS